MSSRHPPQFVVVFDLDKTLVPSLRVLLGWGKRAAYTRDELHNMVKRYKHQGYGIAVNTARLFLTPMMKKYLRSIGIDVDTLPEGAVQTSAINAKRKVAALERIQVAYGNVPAHRILFFDDKSTIVQRAQDNKFEAVQVQRKQPFPVRFL
jgi:hypothetical protein